MSNSENNLFDKLGDFGLGDLLDISIFAQKNTSDTKAQEISKEVPIEDMIYDKQVECPVCDNIFKTKAVKNQYIRMLSRDSDFMFRYKDPNPSLYAVCFCPECGYAALTTKFNTLTNKQSLVIKEKISTKWKNTKKYPPVYTPDISIELHQLALLNSIVIGAKNSEKAILLLKIAWLYRLSGDEKNEKKHLMEALNGFLHALNDEYFPISGMDSPSLHYLIGELHRRIDQNEEALKYFSKVILDKNSKPNIKEMARNQRDIISQRNK